jgi:hypothetical protein
LLDAIQRRSPDFSHASTQRSIPHSIVGEGSAKVTAILAFIIKWSGFYSDGGFIIKACGL